MTSYQHSDPYIDVEDVDDIDRNPRHQKEAQPTVLGSLSSAKLVALVVTLCSVVLLATFTTVPKYSWESISWLMKEDDSSNNKDSVFTSSRGSDFYYNLVAHIGINSTIRYSSLSDDEMESLFETYQAVHKKSYSSSESSQRFQKFKSTLSRIDERNQAEAEAGGTAVHGITKFSDLSDEEFSAMFLTASSTGTSNAKIIKIDNDNNKGNEVDFVDWTGLYAGSIQDQGYCGSCWAYSSTNQIQSDAVRAGLITLQTNFSVQQLVSCDTGSFGCNGGWTESAYEYIIKHGLQLDSTYPYTSYYDESGDCKENSDSKFITISDYYTVKSESEMETYVKSTGPLSVCLDGTDWATYVEGIVMSCGKNVNHCVQIVGIDTSASMQSYWLVRNTWGDTWGEDGYIRISVGKDVCGISTDPTYTIPVLITSQSSDNNNNNIDNNNNNNNNNVNIKRSENR